MMALLHCLRRDVRGAAAMEMVLIAPFLAGLMYVTLDFSGAWLTRLQLEQAAQRGIEAVANRRGIPNNYDYALAEAVTAWGKPLTSSALDNWLECDGVRQGSVTADCGGQPRARYVSITLTAEYLPSFSWGKMVKGTTKNGGLLVRGDATVRVQ